MAEGALQALRDLGRRVPEDVAVVGFDDSSAALACRPPLTTIRQPVEEMAAEMARLLLPHIARAGAAGRGRSSSSPPWSNGHRPSVVCIQSLDTWIESDE